jgi:hypothetical protein
LRDVEAGREHVDVDEALDPAGAEVGDDPLALFLRRLAEYSFT